MNHAEIKDRIREALKIRGMKQVDLVEKTGIDKGQMSSYLSGRYKPKQANLSLIAKALSVDEAWLMGYDVPMESANYEDPSILKRDSNEFLKRNDTLSAELSLSDSSHLYPADLCLAEREHIEKYRSLDEPGRSHVDAVLDWEVKRSRQLLDVQGQLRQSQVQIDSLKLQPSRRHAVNRLLSYYGRIAAAGKSYGFEDMICGTIQVPLTDENRHADFAIGVNGDSMEPDFTGKDIVYVQKATELDKDEIGIFQKDNCIYIKKVGDGVLLSTNSVYDPIPGEDMKVLGRVLGKIHGDYKIIK